MKQPSPNDWDRLEMATRDFMDYYNSTFGYIHGTDYREPINRAILALRLAKETLSNQVEARMESERKLYGLQSEGVTR